MEDISEVFTVQALRSLKAELGNKKLIISNVYITSDSSCSNGYQSSVEHLLTTPDTLILGDFNTHNPSWYFRSRDTRGRNTDLTMVFSTGIPQEFCQMQNRVHQNIAYLITSCSWQTLLTLSSDNLPILIRLQMKTPSNPVLRRTYVNPKKANLERYKQEVEDALSNRYLPTHCQRDEIFRTVLLKAASHHIPTGRHRLHEESVPAETLYVMNRRDALRKRCPTSHELPRLNRHPEPYLCAQTEKIETLC